jgi:chromosome segregation ATPase
LKALVIVVGLVLGLGAALFVLFKDSYADLGRLESEIKTVLNTAQGDLNQSTSALAALRAVRPQMLRLDERLTELRRNLDGQQRRLQEFERARPTSGGARQPFLEERDTAKRQATELAAACAEFRERVTLLDEFVRQTEPKLNQMLVNAGALFASRASLSALRQPDADALVVKLDQLSSESGSTQRMAAQVLDTASKDVAQARVLAETASREITRILAEQAAIAKQIEATLAKSAK